MWVKNISRKELLLIEKLRSETVTALPILVDQYAYVMMTLMLSLWRRPIFLIQSHRDMEDHRSTVISARSMPYT
jgi:hypothetical protein